MWCLCACGSCRFACTSWHRIGWLPCVAHFWRHRLLLPVVHDYVWEPVCLSHLSESLFSDTAFAFLAPQHTNSDMCGVGSTCMACIQAAQLPGKVFRVCCTIPISFLDRPRPGLYYATALLHHHRIQGIFITILILHLFFRYSIWW